MKQKRLIPFDITSIDSLGQGVSKVTDKVTFIPKTVVGDKGEAEVMSEKKGVVFAKLRNLKEVSAKRIKPACTHYNTCPSCHFLHVDYEQEVTFKKESFEKLFRKLPLPPVEVIAATDRFHYRNRIQLHYSLKSKLLGMRDPQTFTITPIPQCLIGLPEIKSELKRLYENNNWLKEAPPAPMEGHVEVYWTNGELKVSWNRPYAEGGFTQVFESMNQKLKNKLSEQWKLSGGSDLLDLFGGNGNLSKELRYSKRLCVDLYKHVPGDEFLNQDLYENKALENVLREIKKRDLKIQHILLDPPRSGFKGLSHWLETLRPDSVVYVSCDPHTLARDLTAVQGYTFTRSFLIDFFPSTFHFESMIFLERKS